MKKGIILLIAVVAAACSKADHSAHKGKMEHSGHKAKMEAKAPKLYQCPMHPTYTSKKPGECPICGMTLIPVEQEEAGGEGPKVEGQARIKIDPRRRQLIGLKTAAVAPRRMVRVIRTVGRVAYDPELYRTQEEYLTALASYKRIKRGGGAEAAGRAKTLLASSRLRLKILGISNTQIAELTKSAKPDVGLLLSQGKGQKLWLYADIYDNELPLVRVGQTVEAVSTSLPGQKFTGRLKAIDPTINPKTRSVRIRVLLSDPRGNLRPDMYLNARIRVDLGERLAIPAEAVVDTGIRQIIFVDEGEGHVSPREPRLGVRAEDYVEVVEGLAEGEKVVTSGNFLVDSESRLKAAVAAVAGGHHHHH